MFYFEGTNICFSNGKKLPAAEWLCQQSMKNSLAFRGLSALCKKEALPETAPVPASVENGQLLFNTTNTESMICIALAFLRSQSIPVNLCENCGRFFVPQKRSDEKYCAYPPQSGEESCRKIGAANAFRKKNAQDAAYIQFQQKTKHLRYLKKQNRLSEAEYSRLFEAEKALLAQNRGKELPALPEQQEAPAPSLKKADMEAYLL